MEVNLNNAGKRIKEIRKQHNYSMALFANLVGNSSASTVNNWEKGNNLPKQDRLEKIAILGNTTTDWIRYGDFTEYIKQLLIEANIEKEFDEEQLKELVSVLKKQKITYSQDLKILTTANELFPDRFESSYQVEGSKQNISLIAEDSTTYQIEQNDRYRTNFLPLIEDLLHDSTQKELNATLLFLILDLLKRSETSKNFSTIKQIFTLLSDVITDDLSYTRKPDSKVFDYASFDSQSNNGKRLSENTVKNKYAEIKLDLETLLDAFYSENH